MSSGNSQVFFAATCPTSAISPNLWSWGPCGNALEALRPLWGTKRPSRDPLKEAFPSHKDSWRPVRGGPKLPNLTLTGAWKAYAMVGTLGNGPFLEERSGETPNLTLPGPWRDSFPHTKTRTDLSEEGLKRALPVAFPSHKDSWRGPGPRGQNRSSATRRLRRWRFPGVLTIA